MRGNGGFFILGILVAALLTPAAVVAATALTRIEGPSGDVAGVNGAKQLLVGESHPAAFVLGTGLTTGGNGCVVLNSRPANAGMVLRQVRWQVTHTTFDAIHTFYLFPNKTCAGAPALVYQPTTLGSHTETIEPGLPIKAGTGVSGRWFAQGTYSAVQIYGYSVPAAAIP